MPQDLRLSKDSLKFVTTFIDDCFFADAEETYCATNSTGVKVHHLDDCWGEPGAPCGSVFMKQDKYAEAFAKSRQFDVLADAKMNELVQQHHMDAALMQVGKNGYLLLRILDETTDEILQFDRLVPHELLSELRAAAKFVGKYYRFPSIWVVETDQDNVKQMPSR